MKQIILIISVLFFAGAVMPVTAQNDQNLSTKEQRKLEKKAKKEARAAAENEAFEKLQQLVKDTAFVFVANRLRSNGGASFSVNPSVNFLAVHGKNATYQFAFQGLVGWNGVGGATFDGEVVKYDFSPAENPNKGADLDMMFRPRGVGGLPYISISFFANSATMNLTLDNGDRITLDGEIKSIQDAGVFKGNTLF